MKNRTLAIKYNNSAINGICPICEGRTDPKIPLAIFLQNDFTDVCDSCSRKNAPELTKLIDYYYKNLDDNFWNLPETKKQPQQVKKYFIYARSAVKPKRGEYSNNNTQIQILKGFAEKKNLEVVDVISEYGSGTYPFRKGLTELLERIKNKQAQGILCTKWDRLTRNYSHYLALKTLFRKANIEVLTLQSNKDDINYLEMMFDTDF